MSLPTLYVFAISHYCEKARWALDFLGIDYQLSHLPPGPHIERVKQLGGQAGSSLPLLVTDGGPVHGSALILDWADRAASDDAKRLTPSPGLEDECRAIEERLDDVAAVHARRSFYSESLVESPETVLPMFLKGLNPEEAAATTEHWALISQMMIARMDLGPAQREESRDILEGELDWFDKLLADGRSYLVGDRFSRADITAASLLAPAALPPEHPTYGDLHVPPKARADLARWEERPALRWVREMYRKHRVTNDVP